MMILGPCIVKCYGVVQEIPSKSKAAFVATVVCFLNWLESLCLDKLDVETWVN